MTTNTKNRGYAVPRMSRSTRRGMSTSTSTSGNERTITHISTSILTYIRIPALLWPLLRRHLPWTCGVAEDGHRHRRFCVHTHPHLYSLYILLEPCTSTATERLHLRLCSRPRTVRGYCSEVNALNVSPLRLHGRDWIGWDGGWTSTTVGRPPQSSLILTMYFRQYEIM
ncbi:hypothetical protein C8R45DRAFT_1043373 [Mycena sanguinolenta]|nr:hypothetical protein C8R45DRAFT_1043373 [Mycena sanguinolenta]